MEVKKLNRVEDIQAPEGPLLYNERRGVERVKLYRQLAFFK